jgi:hypothetical protein
MRFLGRQCFLALTAFLFGIRLAAAQKEIDSDNK